MLRRVLLLLMFGNASPLCCLTTVSVQGSMLEGVRCSKYQHLSTFLFPRPPQPLLVAAQLSLLRSDCCVWVVGNSVWVVVGGGWVMDGLVNLYS